MKQIYITTNRRPKGGDRGKQAIAIPVILGGESIAVTQAPTEAQAQAGQKLAREKLGATLGSTCLVEPTASRPVIFFGICRPKNQDWRVWDRNSRIQLARGFAYAVREARAEGFTSIELQLPDTVELNEEALARMAVSANYQFEGGVYGQVVVEGSDALPAKGKKGPKPLQKIHFPPRCDLKKLRRGEIIGNARNEARSLMNRSLADLSTTRMAAHMEAFANSQDSVTADIWDAARLDKEGFDLTLAVGAGSNQDVNPTMAVILEYNGDPDTDECVGLVGKGVMHDDGGSSHKPKGGKGMQRDMGGLATVFAAFMAAVRLKLKKNIKLMVFLVQNAIGPDATRVDTSIFSRILGTTIFIGNTDAEGRLGLVECVAYALKNWKMILGIDTATLTGMAAAVALGFDAMVWGNIGHLGYFVSRQVGLLCGDMIALAETNYGVYDDLKKGAGIWGGIGNVGVKKVGGISAAGHSQGFEFVVSPLADNQGDGELQPWLHFDLSGADQSADDGQLAKGADSPCIATLVMLCEHADSYVRLAQIDPWAA